MRTTVVIPTYNERENLPSLVERIIALPIPNLVILIVDDRSPDGTGELADAFARTHPWIHVLHREHKEGLGAAYVAGFRHALVNGAEIIVQMDADGSHDPAEISGMIALLSSSSLRESRAAEAIPLIVHEPRDCFAAARNDGKNVDLVIGSRRVPGGRIIGWGWHRRVMSWSAQALARWLLDLRTYDVTSGFRAWHATTLHTLLTPEDASERGARMGPMVIGPARALRWPSEEHGGGAQRQDPRAVVQHVHDKARERIASGYAFQEELLYRAERADLRIVEYPITFRDRTRGQSKLGLRDVVGFFRTLARLWLRTDERRFAFGLGIALVFLTGIPYLYGWWNTPPGFTYTGIHGIAAGDMSVYASYLEQIRDGNGLFTNLFTAESHTRTLNIFWLTAGWFTRLTHLPAPAAFHALRLLLIIPFTLFLATFVAAFLRTPIAGWSIRTVRRTALVFLAFASGIGAYIAPALERSSFSRPGYEHWPIDLWVAESNTFLALYQTPHFIVSLWLLLAIILCTLRFVESRTMCSSPQVSKIIHDRELSSTRWWRSVAAGFAALALFQFHPFYVPTIAAVLVAFTLVMSFARRRVAWDLIAHTAIVFAISTPGIAYHLWLVRVDTVTAWKSAQNLLFTPAWWLVVTGYGFLVPFAITGIVRCIRERTPANILLTSWLIATVFLIFSPLTWQRRLTEGLHVAIVLTAMLGLFPMLAWTRARIPQRIRPYAWTRLTAMFVFVPLLGASTAFNVMRDVELYTLRFPTTVPRYAFYYPNDAIAAMRWIRTHAEPNDATLALGLAGNFLPMYAVRPTVVGHGVETADFARKYRTAYALAEGSLSEEDARAFLIAERVRFILVTEDDRPFWVRDPEALSGVTLVHVNDGAVIYRVTWTP